MCGDVDVWKHASYDATWSCCGQFVIGRGMVYLALSERKDLDACASVAHTFTHAHACRHPRKFYGDVLRVALNETKGLDARALQWSAAGAFLTPGWNAMRMAEWVMAADEKYAHTHAAAQCRLDQV